MSITIFLAGVGLLFKFIVTTCQKLRTICKERMLLVEDAPQEYLGAEKDAAGENADPLNGSDSPNSLS
jgi:hypothetical protein